MSAAADLASKPRFGRMAGRARCARRRIDEAAVLPDAGDPADRGAFLGSRHGTLDRLPGIDRIRVRRFAGARETL